MNAETLREKVVELLESGLTYKALADRAKCDSSTIFRIRKGDIANPSYLVGTAIDAMYAEKKKEKGRPKKKVA